MVTPTEVVSKMEKSEREVPQKKIHKNEKSKSIQADDMSQADQELLNLIVISAGRILRLYDVSIPPDFLTYRTTTAGGGNKLVDRDFGDCTRDTVDEAFQVIRHELKIATATMASVPKPLKFLRPFLESLEDVFDVMKDDDIFKVQLADLLSLLATVRSTKAEMYSVEKKGASSKGSQDPKTDEKDAISKKEIVQRSVLEYRCAGSREDRLSDWGAEYIRCLTADLIAWHHRIKMQSTSEIDMTDSEGHPRKPSKAPLEHLVNLQTILTIGSKCIDYLWIKGAHTESCDLLLELNRLPDLCRYPMDRIEATRMVDYLEAIVKLAAPEDKIVVYQVMFDLSLSHGDLITALVVALECQDLNKVNEVFRITKSTKNKPSEDRMTNAVTSDAWTESCRVTYDLQGADTGRVELERTLRKLIRMQMCYLVSRHSLNFPLKDTLEIGEMEEEDCAIEAEELERIQAVLRREYLHPQFEHLVRELDVSLPRSPEDIFKSGWDDSKKRRGASGLDSQRAALASAYVTAFVHAGFNADNLLTVKDSTYVNRVSQHGVTAVTASLGLIHIWDVEEGLTQIDKFQYSSDPHTCAGALMAFGINSANISNEADPVLALVIDGLKSKNVTERLAAYTALGYGYAGTSRADVFELLVPIVLDLEATGGLEASASAALTLGFAFVGTADEAIAEALVQTLLERAETPQALDTIHAYNFALALGLLFLCRGDEAETVLVSLSAVLHPIGMFTRILIEACAYTASGAMTHIETLLQICITKSEEAVNGPPAEGVDETGDVEEANTSAGPNETPLVAPTTETQPAADPSPDSSPSTAQLASPGVAPTETASSVPDPAITRNATTKQVKEDFMTALPALAVLCMPLIMLREDIGSEMLLRMFNNFLQFDNLFVRRAVPLALALHSASNPRPAIVDLLSKLSHDTDADTALHSIVALGIVAAGTNNARVAQMLRSLAVFYGVDSNALFLIRVSQGLLYTGKGLMSLSPLHQERRLVDKNAMAGLLSFCVQALFTKDTLCKSRYHLNYFHLTLALHPRWLITLDEQLRSVPVQVRVGQAVETAGLAGQPRKMTGFRTHTTPVLLAFDEKAQIGSDEWQAMSNVLEGIVIVRKLDKKEQSRAARSLE